MRYQATTETRPEEVLKLARDFFGGEWGLGEQPIEDGSIRAFAGGGGGVAISARPEDGQTNVELLAREWEIQANEFLRMLSEHRKPSRRGRSHGPSGHTTRRRKSEPSPQ